MCEARTAGATADSTHAPTPKSTTYPTVAPENTNQLSGLNGNAGRRVAARRLQPQPARRASPTPASDASSPTHRASARTSARTSPRRAPSARKSPISPRRSAIIVKNTWAMFSDATTTTITLVSERIAVITAILSLTSVIVVVVASLNIAHVFFTMIAERRGEIGLMRALGARRGDVRALVLAEASCVGLLASVAGVGLARLAGWGCNHLAATRLPAFPFKPDNWFVFSGATVLYVVLFGVGACVLSAIAPAVRASHMEPAAALAGGV